MLISLLDWIYIFFITFILGFLTFKVLEKILKCHINHSITGDVVCGIVVSTVFVQFFSIVYKIGLVANVILVLICLVTSIKYKSELLGYFIRYKSVVLSWEGVLYLGMALVFAFATSRGTIHTDTSLYHAQAIRWYEEYGVVKGLANLQWHYAYNSSYFGFAALFSMGFLSIGPFHCTTGYIALVLCIWAVYNLLDIFKHEKHITDMCCIGILIYALVNYAGFVSPASDYASNFMVLYLLARWAQQIETQKKDIVAYSLLSVLAVYVCTLKLSCGLSVLLVIYPAVYLIKEKRVKEIFVYIACGVLTILPFLIRNVLISGWLIYPFPSIDLFNVDWKLPKEYAIIDSNTIKVWGRCLYDPSLIDTPISQWLPIWWEKLEDYEQSLIICNLIGIAIELIVLIRKIIARRLLSFDTIVLALTCIACTGLWFLTAPFIRYSLGFLISTPMLSLGIFVNSLKELQITNRVSLYKLMFGTLSAYMFFVSCSYIYHYFMDDMVFVKHNLTEPYYITQKPYETSDMAEYDMDGVTFYAPVEGQITGYQYFPSSSYGYMIELTELRGNDINDGFRNTEFQ